MNKVYLGISLMLICTMMCFGQIDKNKKSSTAASDRPDSISLMSGASLEAELQKTVDVNKAKVGDEIVLKVTKSIKQSGEVVIPKGSTLLGRVTEVQRKTKQNSESRLGMIFDRIQGKSLSAPFSASVVSITDAAANVGNGDSVMSDVSGSSRTSGSASGGSSGGGLLGGVGSTVGGLVNTTTQTAGMATNTVVQTAGTASGTIGRTINGIHISNSVNASADSSTTLYSNNKNVRIEKGATFNLKVSNKADRQE